MATIAAWDPKRLAMEVITPGSASAAELMLTLSAPASKTAEASSRLRMPPPTVKGMNKRCAVRLTQFGGVAGVAQVHELHAFDHTAAVNIKTGDDALGQHGSSQKFWRSLRPAAPDVSG